MGCNCNKSNRTRWEVVAGGKVVFTGSNKATAHEVAKRYPDSTVREKAAPAKPAAPQH